MEHPKEERQNGLHGSGPAGEDRRHADRRQAERRHTTSLGGRRHFEDRRQRDRRLKFVGAGLLASMAFAMGGQAVHQRMRPHAEMTDSIPPSELEPSGPAPSGSVDVETEYRAPAWNRETLEPIIQEAAQMYGVPPALIRAVIQTESQFKPTAVSHVGAKGLMQLMPKTARHVGIEDPFNPRENILGGTKYLSMMLDRFKGNTARALAAYNAGPTTVSRFRGIPPYRETQGYVRKIHKLVQDTDAEFSLPAPARVVRKASLRRGAKKASVSRASRSRSVSSRKASSARSRAVVRKASVKKRPVVKKASVKASKARAAKARTARSRRG